MQGSGCLGAHVLPRGPQESKSGPVLSRNHFLQAEHVLGLVPTLPLASEMDGVSVVTYHHAHTVVPLVLG